MRSLVLLTILACRPTPPYYSQSRSITEYDFDPCTVTEGGTEIDTSGFPIDIQEVDRKTDELELCLKEALNDEDFTIDKTRLNVKIAPDSFVAPCTDPVEIFPCGLPVCERNPERGCSITEEFTEHGCYCAGVVQNGYILVVTPNLAAYKHEALHVILQIHDPFPAEFSACE